MKPAILNPKRFLSQTPSAHEIYSALIEIGRQDFHTFAMLCLAELYPAAAVLHNWHYEAMAYRLAQVIDRTCQHLMINLPPRYAKSIFASIALPAYVLGHDPTRQILVISHSLDLAAKLAYFFRRVVNSGWYSLMFPRAKIFRDSELEVVMTEGGCRRAASISGSVTGLGGDPLIFDDPLDAGAAHSDSVRQRTNESVRIALARRDDKKNGAAIIAMQRLHVDDPCGSLLAVPGNNFTVFSQAAIAEKDEQIEIGAGRYYDRRAGELLHAALEPIETLEQVRAQLGSALFAAQYQQNPAPREGCIFKRDWIQIVDECPRRNSTSMIIQSWDTAIKTGEDNDYSALSTVMLHKGHHYIVYGMRVRMEFSELAKFAIWAGRRDNPTRILVEDSALGTPLVNELQRAGLPALAVRAERNKIARLKAQTIKFEAGIVSFVRPGFTSELKDEYLSVPNSRHDDIMDSICQALAYVPHASTYMYDEVTNRNMQKLLEHFAIDACFRRF